MSALMGSYAALAIDQAGTGCFVCREQPASPYGGRPQRPQVAPPAGRRPASPRPLAVATPAVEREGRVAHGMALALRAALGRIAVPLARSAAGFGPPRGRGLFGLRRFHPPARAS